MPTRALTPCRKPGCGALVSRAGHCEAHRSSDRQPFESASRERGTTKQRGYAGPWPRLRRWIMMNEPLCRPCNVNGIIRAATEVDHIVAKANGGTDGMDNLQPICRDCHRLKTAREDSINQPVAFIPDWLRPSLIPLTIIFGPPAAGKSSHIRERAKPRDLVIDLADILERLSGRGRCPERATWLNRAMRYRNELLGSLSRPGHYGAAWFTVGAPKRAQRERWGELLKPTATVLLATPAEVCIARIGADASRARSIDQEIEAVERWWSAYAEAGR